MNGRDGGRLVMEMDSGVLCAGSSYFAGMVLRSRLKVADVVRDCWEIEVDGVENLEGFRGVIEMMYDRDEVSWLVNAGVERAIDVLEVRLLFLLCMCCVKCCDYFLLCFRRLWVRVDEERNVKEGSLGFNYLFKVSFFDRICIYYWMIYMYIFL